MRRSIVLTVVAALFASCAAHSAPVSHVAFNVSGGDWTVRGTPAFGVGEQRGFSGVAAFDLDSKHPWGPLQRVYLTTGSFSWASSWSEVGPQASWFSALDGWGFNIVHFNTGTFLRMSSGGEFLLYDRFRNGFLSCFGCVTSKYRTLTFADIIKNSVSTPHVVNELGAQWEVATFSPNFGLSLTEAATFGGYAGFNWLNVITFNSSLDRCHSEPAECYPVHFDATGKLLELSFEDPPANGGYQGVRWSDDKSGYWTQEQRGERAFGNIPAVQTGTSLSFIDGPCLPREGDVVKFSTYLAGMDDSGNVSVVFIGGNTSFKWQAKQIGTNECGVVENLSFISYDEVVPHETEISQLGFLRAEDIDSSTRFLFARNGIEMVFLDDEVASVPEPTTFQLSILSFLLLVFFGMPMRCRALHWSFNRLM